MRAGEWLFYENMGAYTSVAASRFNGFETPQPFYAISERCWQVPHLDLLTGGNWGLLAL
jgi:hypothetical protein